MRQSPPRRPSLRKPSPRPRSPPAARADTEVRGTPAARAAAVAKALEKELADKAAAAEATTAVRSASQAPKAAEAEPQLEASAASKAGGLSFAFKKPKTATENAAEAKTAEASQKASAPDAKASANVTLTSPAQPPVSRAQSSLSPAERDVQHISMADRSATEGPPLNQYERVRRFVEDSGLDHRALDALKGLRPELQKKLMEEGPIPPGGQGPLVVLMTRIRKVVAEASQAKGAKGDGPQVVSPPSAPLVCSPLSVAPVNAAVALAVPPVMSETTLGAAKPKSSQGPALVGRVLPPPPCAPQGACLPAPPPSGINVPDLVSAFAMQNRLPSQAEATLRELPPNIAVLVMQSGPLGGTDVIGALVQRVQKAVAETTGQPIQA